MPKPTRSQSPYRAPLAWDKPVLYVPGRGRLVLPGAAKISGSIGIREDSKTADGQNGKTVSYLGQDPAKITINLRIWTEQQFAALINVLAIIRPTDGKAIKPVTIDHPLTALLGVRAVYLFSVSVPEFTPESEWSIPLEFSEWFPDEDKGAVSGKPLKGSATSATNQNNQSTAAAAVSSAARPSNRPVPLPPAAPAL